MGRFSTGPKTQSINQLLGPGSLRIEELFSRRCKGSHMVEYLMKGVLKGGLRSIKNFSARGYMAGVAVQKTKFSAIDRLDGLSALGAAVNVFDADLLTVAEACDTHEPSQDWGGHMW